MWRRQRMASVVHHWHNQWRKRQRIAEHEEQIAAMGIMAMKRRYFIYWQHGILSLYLFVCFPVLLEFERSFHIT